MFLLFIHDTNMVTFVISILHRSQLEFVIQYRTFVLSAKYLQYCRQDHERKDHQVY